MHSHSSEMLLLMSNMFKPASAIFFYLRYNIETKRISLNQLKIYIFSFVQVAVPGHYCESCAVDRIGQKNRPESLPRNGNVSVSVPS